MKTRFFLAAFLLLFCATSLWASNTIVDGIWYDFNDTDLTASVTYRGSSADRYANEYYGSITIPSLVSYTGNTYSVISIGNGAFGDCSWLTSVTIPNSVISIGNVAFYGCSSLTSITIPNSVTSIGENVFGSCSNLTSMVVENGNTIYDSRDNCNAIIETSTNTLISGCKNTIIPNSVTSIGEWAFDDCSGLTSVIIPNSVTNIKIGAFYGCSGLTSITIPNSVTSIGSKAFYGCSGLTSVIIPNSVTSIGDYAFIGCSGLTSVTIPNSVTTIGQFAFSNCSGLTGITISNNVTTIGNGAFYGCNITSINFWGTLAEWCNKSWSPWQISYNYALYIDSALQTDITIPDGVSSIGNVFTYCSSLTSVTIGNSVTSIGSSAFYGCSGLTSVTIGNSVTSIGENVFGSCSNLTSMTMLGETPPFISGNMFDNSNPPSIYVPCGTLDVYKQSWSSYSSKIKYLPLAYTITGEVNDSNAGNVTVPANICEQLYATPNYGYHFTQWSDGVTDNPRTIELTQDTTLIAEFAVDKSGSCGIDLALTWEYDSDKKILTISGTGDLTDNKRYGVEANKEMISLVIEEGVGIIGDSAFANIPTLTTVKIGKDVRKIQDYAFGNCYNLASIYNYRPTPATIVANTFEEVDKYACTLYVLPDSEEMYRSAVGWSDFYNILPIPASAIEEIISENSFTVSPQKIIDNGQLFILLPDGSKYTATGVKVE